MSYDHKTSLATIELLAETFPQCFSVFEGRRYPLKVGIHHDVLQQLDGTITAKELSANRRYLAACKEGAPRIDLAGNTVGTISAKGAADAKLRLEHQQAKRKRQQEAQAKEQEAAERKARNAGRLSLGDLRKAAEKRRMVAANSFRKPSDPPRLVLREQLGRWVSKHANGWTFVRKI
jgi:ProP effector